MRAFAPIFLGIALFGSAAGSRSQTADPPASSSAKAPAEVSFQFERPGLPVPKFTLRIREDGTGRYEAEQAERPATANSMRGQAAQHIDRQIT